MKEFDEEHAHMKTQQNLKKQFTLLPKSPNMRVLMLIQKERAKPLTLPDPDEANIAAVRAKVHALTSKFPVYK